MGDLPTRSGLLGTAGQPTKGSETDNPEGTDNQDNQAENENEPITRAEAQRLLAEAEQKILRQTQSLTDKAASRFDKELNQKLEVINNSIATMKAAGVEIPEEKVIEMKRKAYDEALANTGSLPPEAGQPNPAGEKTAQPAQHPLDAVIGQMFEKHGVEIEPTDPEFATLDRSSDYALLNSLEQACIQKAQRISTSPEARMTSLGAGRSYTPDEAALVAELEELQKNPTENRERRKEILTKLRAK